MASNQRQEGTVQCHPKHQRFLLRLMQALAMVQLTQGRGSMQSISKADKIVPIHRTGTLERQHRVLQSVTRWNLKGAIECWRSQRFSYTSLADGKQL